MKKIVFIFIFIIFMIDINALEWSNEIKKGYDIVKTERRYMFFEEQLINEEYLSRDNGNQFFVDYEDYILSDYIEYESLNSVLEEDLITETEEVEIKLSENDTTNILFDSFNISGDLYFCEITLYYDYEGRDTIIDFKVNNLWNKEQDLSLLVDGNKTDKNSCIKVENSDILNIDLLKEYNNKKIKILVNYYTNNVSGTFATKFTNSEDKYILASKTFTFGKQIHQSENIWVSLFLFDSQWTETYMFPLTQYKYRIKLFKKYDIERKYLEGYHIEKEGYTKDESMYKDFYLLKEALPKNQTSKLESKLPIKKELDLIEEVPVKKEVPEKTESEYIALNSSDRVPKQNNSLLYIFLSILLLIFIIVLILIVKKCKLNKSSNIVESV